MDTKLIRASSERVTGRAAGPTRRTVLAGSLGAAATVALHPDPARAAVAAPMAASLRLGAGTDFAVRVSPDGARLALDVLGVCWVMSSSGGAARRLTSDLDDIAQPDWSPDGERLVYQAYRDGRFHLWTIRPDGSDKRQLTDGPFDQREPRWSPDGGRIVFSSDAGGSYGIHVYDLTSGRTSPLTDSEADEYEPCWSPDGTKVAFVTDTTTVETIDIASGRRSVYARAGEDDVVRMPQWTADGAHLVFHVLRAGRNELVTGSDLRPVVEGEECFPFRVSFHPDGRMFYTANGAIRHRAWTPPAAAGPAGRVGFVCPVDVRAADYRRRATSMDDRASRPVVGIGSPVISPDARSVAFRALGDLWTMRFGRSPVAVGTDPTWWWSDPDFSADGRRLAYCSDRGGTINIWVRDLASGEDTQVTHFTDSAALSVRWSPDGRDIAFLDQEGALFTVDVASGAVQKVFDATFEPGRPTWSPDGRFLALAAVQPYSKRFREGLSKILVIDRTTGEAVYHDAAPHTSLQTRGDDGPVWSPDGAHLLFAMKSVLWVMPMGRDGRPSGPARQVTQELSDAPTWAGDSRTILYLSGGRLRRTRLTGSGVTGTRTMAMPLTWRNHPGHDAGDLVIRAGRMWDGQAESVRRDVDIVVRGQRIVSIAPRSDAVTQAAATLIDARDKFVMPGLIDCHHHRQMAGYAYGNRQHRLWLALGFTTTRSPGDPAYHMVEDREAVGSGARVGPRFVGTGEAVDGSRIYYNFMRPTYDSRQLRLELERAQALEYDLMKCYVRLPVVWHKQVIEWAHRRGIEVTSHYHYPAMAFGGDCTEHVGATNRFGYSRTVTNVGSGYPDVVRMFAASEMRRTPTLFNSGTLYREDDSLVRDARVRTLNPTWRLAELEKEADTARTEDQAVTRADLKRRVEQCLAITRAGGYIIMGTDSPIDDLAVSSHMNLRAMVAYGYTPREALMTATSAAGRYLARPLGVLRTGMLADLVVVDGDPLERIEDAANVTTTIVGGRVHTVTDLVAPYADKPGSGSGAARGRASAGGQQSLRRNRIRARAPAPRHRRLLVEPPDGAGRGATFVLPRRLRSARLPPVRRGGLDRSRGYSSPVCTTSSRESGS